MTIKGLVNWLRGNVVALAALFFALGGGSAYAATHLAANSVGAAQLKKNAVVSSKGQGSLAQVARLRKRTASCGTAGAAG